MSSPNWMVFADSAVRRGGSRSKSPNLNLPSPRIRPSLCNLTLSMPSAFAWKATPLAIFLFLLVTSDVSSFNQRGCASWF